MQFAPKFKNSKEITAWALKGVRLRPLGNRGKRKKNYFTPESRPQRETEVNPGDAAAAPSGKAMRREYAKQQTIGPVLSLDAIRDGGSMDESAWLLDYAAAHRLEVLTAELTDAFCKTRRTASVRSFGNASSRGKPDWVCCGARHQRPYGQQADSRHPGKGKNIFFLMVKIPQKNVH